jgi:hypothetical protein
MEFVRCREDARVAFSRDLERLGADLGIMFPRPDVENPISVQSTSRFTAANHFLAVNACVHGREANDHDESHAANRYICKVTSESL